MTSDYEGMSIEELETEAQRALDAKVYINEIIEKKKLRAGLIKRPPLLTTLLVLEYLRTDEGAVYIKGDTIEVFPEEAAALMEDWPNVFEWED